MQKEKFEFIKKKYGHYASWAVFGEEGNLPKSNMSDLSMFENIDILLNNTYSCYIDELDKKKILNGNKVLIAENSRSFVKIYDKSSRFLGVGTINKNSELIPKKILV